MKSSAERLEEVTAEQEKLQAAHESMQQSLRDALGGVAKAVSNAGGVTRGDEYISETDMDALGKEVLRDVTAQLNALKEETTDVRSELALANDKITEKAEAVNLFKTKLTDLQREHAKSSGWERRQAKIQEQVMFFAEQIQQNDIEIATLKGEVAAGNTEIQKVNDEKRKLSDTAEALKMRVDASTAQFAMFDTMNKELTDTNMRLKTQVKDLMDSTEIKDLTD